MAPRARYDFKIAIICALSHEAEAVIPLFDIRYGDYGRSTSDPYQYTVGRVGNQDVVLAYMPGMGKRNAAAVASNLRSSFPSIELALIVGICGGVPFPEGRKEIILGDVVLSDSIIEYDFGRQYHDGFQRKTDMKSSLPQLNPALKSFVSKIKTHHEEVQREASEFLSSLQEHTKDRYTYPGKEYDVLYEASYHHKGSVNGPSPRCDCTKCGKSQHSGCESVIGKNCSENGCDGVEMKRKRLEFDDPSPLLHIGSVASGDTVMKSSEHRDKIAKQDQTIAFEMEGSGAWDVIPCLVVKGVCDYADSHKSKGWQNYAAATAACCTKAILTQWTAAIVDEVQNNALWVVPFQPDENFVGRKNELGQLVEGLVRKKLSGVESFKKMAIYGLGGIGKTSTALKFAERVRELEPRMSIFWVPSMSSESFEQAYRNIGAELGLLNMKDENRDVKKVIKEYFNKGFSGRWLMIFDSADNIRTWYERQDSGVSSRLADYVPHGSKGCALLTTRNKEIAQKFASKSIVSVEKMDRDTCVELLRHRLEREECLHHEQNVEHFLEQMCFLPLALVQASSFINKMDISIGYYLTLIAKTEKNLIKVLSKDFEDDRRYTDQKNPIASTWIVSFEQMRQNCPLAAEYLSLFSFLENKAIPASFLSWSQENELDALDAIACLLSFSFISKRHDQAFDMHRLVGISTRAWLQETGKFDQYYKKTVHMLAAKFTLEAPNFEKWRLYRPHFDCTLTLGRGRLNVIRSHGMLLQRYAHFLFLGERYVDAEIAYKELLEITEQLYNCQSEEVLQIKARSAFIHGQLENFEESEKILNEVLDTLTNASSQSEEFKLSVIRMLAEIYSAQAKYDKAESLLKAALESAVCKLGQEHYVTESTMESLANLHIAQRNYSDAEQETLFVLESRKNRCGLYHCATLGTMRNLSLIYIEQERYKEAEEMLFPLIDQYQTGLVVGELSETALPECKKLLAHVYKGQGRYSEAERHFMQALEGFRVVDGGLNSEAFRCMKALSDTYVKQRKYKEAIKLGEQLVHKIKLKYGEVHCEVARSMNALAAAIFRDDRYEKAEELFNQAFKIAKTTLGEKHHDTLKFLCNLALIRHKAGRTENALLLMRECLQSTETTLDSEHDLAVSVREKLERWRVEAATDSRE